MSTRRLRTGSYARRLLMLASAATLLIGAPSSAAAQTPEPVLAPRNPAFTEAVTKIGLQPPTCSRGVRSPLCLGYIPGPVLVNHGPLTKSPVRENDMPSSYDLRDHDKLTAVRDQYPYGTCWAFATMGALESALLPGQTTDFSEDNLVNYSGFVGPEGTYESGGLYSMSLAYLLRQSGPKREQADAYPTPELTRGATTQKWVRNVWMIPPRGDEEWDGIVKWTLMSKGAVATDMCWDEDSYSWDSAAFYYDGDEEANHAVCIVGWDDSFPRTGFRPDRRPPQDGAWLIRNSWGQDFGDGGYFWISYCDAVMGDEENLVFTRVIDVDRHAHLYGHDRLGMTDTLGFAANVASSTGWMAGSFRAKRAERVVGAGFYMVSGGRATIYVGRSLKKLRRAAAKTIDMPGYYTVGLKKALRLRRGQRFVVAVRITTPGHRFPIPLQTTMQGFARAKAKRGMSYVSPDGARWTDTTRVSPGAAVCLKAVTRHPLSR